MSDSSSKIKKAISIYLIFELFICLTIYSCGPNLLFENALPPDIKPVFEIPQNYVGTYVCESDSSIIYVDTDLVYRKVARELKTTIQNIRETEYCSIVNGSIYLAGHEQCLPFEYLTEDSIIVRYDSHDTLFNLNQGDILKTYEGSYYLNVLTHNKLYMTYVIKSHIDGSLEWNVIDAQNKTKKIRTITSDVRAVKPANRDSVYIIDPTLKEFKELIEKEFISKCDFLIPFNFEKSYLYE